MTTLNGPLAYLILFLAHFIGYSWLIMMEAFEAAIMRLLAWASHYDLGP